MSAMPPPAVAPPSRHRRERPRSRGPVLAATAIVTAASVGVLAVLAATASGWPSSSERSSSPDCPRPLQVAVAPELSAAVTAAAAAMPARRTGSCDPVKVTARRPAEVAADVAGSGAVRPDVWIPDSSIWAERAGGLLRPQRQGSIATSPVVVAVSVAVARTRGWPAQALDFSQLISETRLGLAEPRYAAPTVGVLTAVRTTLAARPDAPERLASSLRRAATGLSVDPARALIALTDPQPVAVAVSEQAVWAANTAAGSTRAVAGYLPGAGMTLDYPFFLLNSAAPTRALADRLLAVLQHGAGHEALLARGFRSPTTGEGPALRNDRGVLAAARTSAGVPSAGTVADSIRTLQAVARDSRILTVIDVSGSMGAAVPRAGTATRLDLVSAAAARGLGLYPDRAEIGLWTFATDLTPSTDYREVVPIGPLGDRPDGVSGRERLVQALGAVRRIPHGDTGLYDTTLAAVRAVRTGWDTRRANSVVLLTDGRNDDRRSIGLAELLRTLRRESDPGRPVPVITIAYGATSDASALGAISAATGGTVYRARDARKIDRVFLDAIGRRACSPTCSDPN